MDLWRIVFGGKNTTTVITDVPPSRWDRVRAFLSGSRWERLKGEEKLDTERFLRAMERPRPKQEYDGTDHPV